MNHRVALPHNSALCRYHPTATLLLPTCTLFPATMSLTPAEIARRYSTTLTSPNSDADLASIFASTVTIFHCWDEKAIQLPSTAIAAAMTRKLALCVEKVRDYHNTVQPLHVASTGISMGIVSRGFYPDGSALFICRCVVLTLDGSGLVERVDNYGDHAQSQALDALIPHQQILKHVQQ